MISTVTTSTISTVTSVALAGSAALIGILVLFALVLQKEITTSSNNKKLHRLSTALNISIIPLLIAFVLTVIAKVSEVLH